MIIVTSGHVDHGKTALIQALTGTHTAHLPEEKKRGMTIDLGYAYLPVGDTILGFIDVPGHEKFLVNMLAGLGGIHYAMLIVAADEGIKPQTEEHLSILRLLQIEHIIPVITKADRADNEKIDELRRKLTENNPILQQSPFFITSAQSGQGIEELRRYLAELPNLNDPHKPFRYAIDRVFSLKGAGTVVTGTAFAGKVSLDDELFLSKGVKVRVKGIHAQNNQSQTGTAGQRLALNLAADMDRSLIERGDWLLAAPPLAPTDRLTLWLEAQTALNENQAVHCYHAADRSLGKLNLLNQKSLPPGGFALAELILDKPLFLAYGDRLILRSGDAKTVIGGARVVEIDSVIRHKRSEARLDFLKKLLQAHEVSARIALYLQQKAYPTAQLAWIEQLTLAQLRDILAQNGDIYTQDWCFSQSYAAQKKSQILTALSDYHQQHGDQLGLSKARLYRMACINQPEKLIYRFIDELLADGQLAQTRGWIHLPDHKIAFSAEEEALWQAVCLQFEAQQYQALWVRDLGEELGVEEKIMRNFLYKAGKLGYAVAIVRDRFMLTETVYQVAAWIKAFILEQGAISVNQLRDHLQFGRKMTVQLMEYYDRCGFLRRKGNLHILRDSDVFDLSS